MSENSLLDSQVGVITPQASLALSPTVKAWAVVLCSGLFFLFEFIQMNMVNSLTASLMQAFNASASDIGVLSSYYFWSTMVFLFPAGIILDRLSTKKIILCAMTVCIISAFIFSQAHSLGAASFSRFLAGFGSAFCFVSSLRLASRWLPPKHMALATGLVVTLAFIGGTIAQAPFTLVMEAIGWRHTVLLDAGLGIIIFLVILTVVQDYPNRQLQLEEEKSLQQIGFWRSLQRAYLNWQNWLCGIYTNMMNLGVFLLGAIWGGIYLQQAHGFSANHAAVVCGAIFIGTLVGSPVAGWISDAMGQRKLPMQITAVLSLIVLLMILYVPGLGFGAMLTLFFLLGFITSGQVISYPLVSESNPLALTAMCISVVSFNAMSGGAIFQPLVGKLLDARWTGQMDNGVRVFSNADYQHAFLVLIGALVLALVVTFFMKESQCERMETK